MPTNRKGFRDLLPETLPELMIIVVIIGILAAIAIPNFMNMQNRAREAKVKSNAHTIQLAVEDFYVQSGRLYPRSVMDKLPNGTTLIQLLPGGALLQNPFTKKMDPPVNGFAAKVGEVGYMPIDSDADGVIDGYEITGHGHDGLIITLTGGQ